jgi:hypothetical protein
VLLGEVLEEVQELVLGDMMKELLSNFLLQ